MSTEPIRITLQGRAHAVTLPPSIIDCEELFVAWNEIINKPKVSGLRVARVAAALVGACTRIGREAGATYNDCGCDPLVFGGTVYNHLKKKGSLDGLVPAASATAEHLLESLVALAEAQKQADFTDPREEP